MIDFALLFVAGVVGGMLNSIAGGGSFITFPVLLYVGVPPVSANATNTFASCSGYLSGAYALRRELRAHRKELPLIIGISLIGGFAGALLLMQTPESLFRQAIPWLLLIAMLLFVFGEKLNLALRECAGKFRYASHFGRLLLLLLLLCICTYGGFFNAGLGIITLSYLALAGYTNINTMNGIKLLISSVVSLIAIAIFINDGVIAWYEGVTVLVGTLSGGYVAAHYSRKLPQRMVRNFVVLIGMLVTSYYFADTYLSTL